MSIYDDTEFLCSECFNDTIDCICNSEVDNNGWPV